MASIQAVRAEARNVNAMLIRAGQHAEKADKLKESAKAQLEELKALLPDGVTIEIDEVSGHVSVQDASVRRTDLIAAVRVHAAKEGLNPGWKVLGELPDDKLQEVIGSATTERGAMWKAGQAVKEMGLEPEPAPAEPEPDPEPESKPEGDEPKAEGTPKRGRRRTQAA